MDLRPLGQEPGRASRALPERERPAPDRQTGHPQPGPALEPVWQALLERALVPERLARDQQMDHSQPGQVRGLEPVWPARAPGPGPQTDRTPLERELARVPERARALDQQMDRRPPEREPAWALPERVPVRESPGPARTGRPPRALEPEQVPGLPARDQQTDQPPRERGPVSALELPEPASPEQTDRRQPVLVLGRERARVPEPVPPARALVQAEQARVRVLEPALVPQEPE
jgi:hypothetical protein